MRFWLGTHESHWLKRDDMPPLFVSRRRLLDRSGHLRRRLPIAATEWALDSGGFTELSMHGRWTIGPHRYAAEVRRITDEIGHLAWAAPQDWMCEPDMLTRTGLTVADHQARTVHNYLDLRTLWPDGPFIPVLQGWTRDDYLRCVDLYAHHGIDLEQVPLVGLGSVCRRQGLAEAEHIVHALQPLRLHGFGAKGAAIALYGNLMTSMDSMAWSYAGRRRPDPNCPKRTCANCAHYALTWRDRALTPTTPTLWGATHPHR